MGEQNDGSPDFLFRPISGGKMMRKVILTNGRNRSMNSNAHRVVGESARLTAGEAHSKRNGKACPTAGEIHSKRDEKARPTAEEQYSAKTEEARFHTAEVSTAEELRLFTASEAARILHVSRNAIYALWRDGQLDFWRINGTMTTNLTAIRNFLERTKGGVDKSVWE